MWHIGGLGASPGAVTVPLSYVYLLLKAAPHSPDAKAFFEASGERDQERKGAPQVLVLFTSEEVIKGEIQQREIRDDWFKTRRQSSAPKTIVKYLTNLLEWVRYEGKWIEDIYLVKVDHQNFEDCFTKIGVTLKALKGKELWANMVGGTNAINAALLTGGALLATIQRYYYVFQRNIDLLHPEMDGRPDLRGVEMLARRVLDRWYELPIFQLKMGAVIDKLREEFQKGVKLHLRQVESILEEERLSPKDYIPKLRGRLIHLENETTTAGPILHALTNLLSKIEKADADNYSQWVNWARRERILYRLTFEGRIYEMAPQGERELRG